MKAFVAYRHTGEKFKDLEELLTTIRDSLAEAGVEAYATFFNEDNFKDEKLGPAEIMDYAFNKIEELGILFVVQTSDSKSEGMLMEVGFARAKGIPIIVATHSSVQYTYVPDMADYSFTYGSPKDLSTKIQEINFSGLVSS